MSLIKKHYEEYWESKGHLDTFAGYERNKVLPRLFIKDENVLDLGCGDGAVGEYLVKTVGIKLKGLDISEKAIKEARRRGIDASLYDLDKPLPFKDNTFDVVFWGDNVEHLFKPEKVLAEIRRVLKIDGRLVLSCPNMGYWRYRLYYLFHGRLADSEWSGQAPWSWGHIRFFNYDLLEKFLALEGFKINKSIGVSRRRLDLPFVNFLPNIFGMIFVIEAS